MAVIAFASCSKNTDNQSGNNPSDTDGPKVSITLKGESEGTRAFFDNTAAAESWEKEIGSLSTYVFDSYGNLILRRTFTPGEITARQANFSLPNSTAGTTCSFYVVANAEYGTVASKSAMEAAIEAASLDEYNGEVSVVMERAKRAGGFVMNGSRTTTVAAEGQTTNVAVSLKRVVAKVAVRTTVDPSFSDKYGQGTVFITDAELTNISAGSYSFPGNVYPRTQLKSYTQVSSVADGNSDNLFYVYENEAPGSGDHVILILSGVFDADGDPLTTQDQMDVEYRVTLTGEGDGALVRNGYYRVQATVKGLSGDGVVLTITVADWETPITQTVNLGQ